MATVFSKLQYKTQERILLLNAPDEFRPLLAEVQEIAQIDESANGPTSDEQHYDFAIVFVKSAADIEAMAPTAASAMTEDALLWFAYPKKASKTYKTDISRDNGWQPLGDLGYEPVRQIAIDADWSALRFRLAANIKSMTRSFAMSKEGKRRTNKQKK